MLRFSILRGLVFFSVAAILILPLYTIFFLSPSFVEFITDLKEQQAQRVAEHMESKLIPNETKLEKSMLTADVLHKIDETSKDFKLKKVRIMFPSGEILYSTTPQEIGKKIVSGSSFLASMANGKPITQFTAKGTHTLEGKILSADIVETYVPISRDNKFIGAFQIYYDVTADRERLSELVGDFYATLFPIAIGLLCAVCITYYKANKNIIRRQEAEEKLRAQSAELQEKNDELAELFLICKDRQRQLETAQQERLEAQNQVQKELIKRERLRMELLRHTVQAQEEERARIARELHDETAQTLTAASLNFATLKNKLEGMPEVSDVVNRLQNLCKQMNHDLYRLVHDLRPAQLDDLGLIPALRYLVDEGQANTNIDVGLTVHGQQQRLEPFVETVIFRIVQESLTNVARHAETNTAKVELCFEQEQVILRVIDNGKGFDTNRQETHQKGWGLIGMAERAESINGRFLIESFPGKGTTIEVIIQLNALSCPLDISANQRLAD